MGVDSSSQISKYQSGRQQSKAKMDIFRNNVIAKIKRDKIQEVQIHRVVGKYHRGDFIHSTVPEVQLRNGQMMDQGVSADRRDT